MAHILHRTATPCVAFCFWPWQEVGLLTWQEQKNGFGNDHSLQHRIPLLRHILTVSAPWSASQKQR